MEEEVQLDFENQMFIELLAQDGMVVLARLVINVLVDHVIHVLQGFGARETVSKVPKVVL